MEDRPPELALRLPADAAYLAILRTATAGLAARLDFTLDDIEDLRIAVDEACALLLPQARAESELECSFFVDEARLSVAVTASSDTPHEPIRDGFAWTVLSSLTSSLDVAVDDDRLTIRLSRVADGAQAP